jgi:hypothetical protein
MTETPRTDGPVPAIGVFGVGAAAISHEQFVLSVQLALRHAPSVQTKPLVQSEFTVQSKLHPDNAGIGVGVAVV